MPHIQDGGHIIRNRYVLVIGNFFYLAKFIYLAISIALKTLLSSKNPNIFVKYSLLILAVYNVYNYSI